MLVLGSKYHFTDLELLRLKKRLSSDITDIPVYLRPDEDVISDIEEYLNNNENKVIVLNLRQAP
ncbi:hypothetical protein JHD50_01795, partial [Sulfurimonas sp. MAG313]|nr:hypothetical protein [Sulfurimonas sp. MAG313]